MKHLLALATLTLAGCALTSRGTPLEIRYFSLDVQGHAPAAPAQAVPANKQTLRIASVSAAAHLRERMVYRETPFELGYYERRRWSERPDAFVRRALQHALFADGHVQQAIGGDAPALEVTLLSLEELRGDKPKVRAQLALSLLDGLHVVLDQTVTAEREIRSDGDSVEALLRAYDQALRQLVDDACREVWGALDQLPSAQPAPSSKP